jgi:hypothetical protein
MSTIPLLERVPSDYRRTYLFFAGNEIKAFICVEGKQELEFGITEDVHEKLLSLCMDWQAEVITEIRDELQRMT